MTPIGHILYWPEASAKQAFITVQHPLQANAQARLGNLSEDLLDVRTGAQPSPSPPGILLLFKLMPCLEWTFLALGKPNHAKHFSSAIDMTVNVLMGISLVVGRLFGGNILKPSGIALTDLGDCIPHAQHICFFFQCFSSPI